LCGFPVQNICCFKQIETQLFRNLIMKPFRYLTDVAYVVPALRSHSEWPKINRRKVAIVVGVLSAHAALIWTLVNMAVNTPPPIEFVETQVVLEQVTPDNPVPTAIPSSPKVIKRQQEKVRSQPQQARRVNNDAEIKETVQKPATSKPQQTSSATASSTMPEQTTKSTPAATEATTKPTQTKASASECGKALKLVLNPQMAVRADKLVSVDVRRNASARPASVSLVGTTGDAALDVWVERMVQARLRFFKTGVQCDGTSARLTALIKAND
jgi:outer membrane biosynthesis protein TonB